MNSPISRRSVLCNLAGGTATAAAAALAGQSRGRRAGARAAAPQGQNQSLRLPLVLRQRLVGQALPVRREMGIKSIELVVRRIGRRCGSMV